MENFPRDLSFYVISFLNHIELCKLRRINKNWKDIVDHDNVWKALAKRIFDLKENDSGGKEENETWNRFYIRLATGKFDPQYCTNSMHLSENDTSATTLAPAERVNSGYQMVVGTNSFHSGTHYWEFEVKILSAVQCMCFGVVNDRFVIHRKSSSHGMFCDHNHGWGYYVDGDRCHNGRWITGGRGWHQGDKVGILLHFYRAGYADIYFFLNGVCDCNPTPFCLTGIGPGPFWPSVSMMNPGDSVRMIVGLPIPPIPKPTTKSNSATSSSQSY